MKENTKTNGTHHHSKRNQDWFSRNDLRYSQQLRQERSSRYLRTATQFDDAVYRIMEPEKFRRKYDAVRNRKAWARLKVVDFDGLAPFHDDDVESVRDEQK